MSGELFEATKRWGRWGEDDDRGALNLLTPERVTKAAALVFASPSVAVLGVLLVSFLAFVGVPYEERMLHRRLGADYDAYVRTVPRWLARPHRSRT